MKISEYLSARDPNLAVWIERLGDVEIPPAVEREPYLALLESVAYQQLAGNAARAIWKRVLGLFEDGNPCSRKLVQMSDEQLRAAGLSRSKVLSMRDICTRMNAGSLPTAANISLASDEEISEQLLEVRGIGPWTVDMFMIFSLRRPDIMPATDYGVRKGFQALYRKRQLPSPQSVLKHSRIWQPHRSTAAMYLWRIAESAAKQKKPRPKAKPPAKRRAIS